MPRVRNLSDSSTVPAVAPAVSNQLAVADSLPAWLAEVPVESAPLDRPTAPYVANASTRSSRWDSLRASGCQDGDFYLTDESGQVFPLRPFRYHLVCAVAYHTAMDAQGEVTAAAAPSGDRPPEGMDEHYLAIVIADLNGVLIPAKLEVRRTKVGAIRPAIAALQQASSPDWPSLSAEHRASASFPLPLGRFLATATTVRRVARSTGNAYHAGTCACRPSTTEERSRLAAALNDAAFLARLEAVRASWDARNVRLQQLAQGV